MIVGHNDTHFNLLKNIKSDDEFTVSTYANSGLYYRVREVKVVNETDLSVIENSGGELVTLITCYPFDSETFNSKLRFVVTAERIKDTRSSITVAMVEKGD